jgi:small-conductance mechanosensitive channel
MPGELQKLIDGFTTQHAIAILRALFILALGFVVARLIGRWLRLWIAGRGDPQRAELVGRLSTWGIFGLSLAGALQELGFQLGVLLGAAGVLTVAIGFASQTTLSNLISGFFLFGESPFKLGDTIEVEGVTGEVLSIDMMSTKLRTFDNRYVRIPNELIIKTKVLNYTRFPIRRLDLGLRIIHQEEFERVREIVLEVIDDDTLALDQPAPAVFVSKFGEMTLEVGLWVWVQTKDFGDLQTTLPGELQRAFLKREIKLVAPIVALPSPFRAAPGASG